MFEQVKLSELFGLNADHEGVVEVVSRSAKGVACLSAAEKIKPHFSFQFSEVIRMVEYFSKPYVGVPMVVNSHIGGGKSNYARQVALRLNLDFHYFDMSVLPVAALWQELELLYSRSKELRGSNKFVVHLDNVNAITKQELQPVVDAFDGKFQAHFRVVLTARRDEVVDLKVMREISLSALSVDRAVKVLVRNAEAFDLSKIEVERAKALASIIVEICNDYFEFIQIDLALLWFNESLTMLRWGLNTEMVVFEALNVLKHCVDKSELATLRAIAEDVTGKKLKLANAR